MLGVLPAGSAVLVTRREKRAEGRGGEGRGGKEREGWRTVCDSKRVRQAMSTEFEPPDRGSKMHKSPNIRKCIGTACLEQTRMLPPQCLPTTACHRKPRHMNRVGFHRRVPKCTTGGEQLLFHAERDISAGEEIFNCYGMQDRR